MGLTSFLKDVGDVAASAVTNTASAINTVDRYVNPFHRELRSLPRGRQDRSYDTAAGNAIVGFTNPKLEAVSNGLNWTWQNVIAPPITTTILQGKRASGGPGVYFHASDWAAAWHAAQHISPGQALLLGNVGNPNDPRTATLTNQAINAPLDYYKPGSAYLPPGFDRLPREQQQQFLKQAGMPVVGNAYIDELRQSSKFYKYSSGLADIAVRWEADPTVLAGKALSSVRVAKQVMRRPPTGWSPGDIDKIMANSTMAKAQDYIWQNRDNPALLNNLQMVQRSALGPRFGAIASTLQSPAEVHDFMRVILGDASAIDQLASKNALASARIAQDTSRYAALDMMHTRYANLGDGRMTNLISQQMDELNARVNADTSLVNRYNQVLDHANELDEVNLSRWSFARAEQRTDAQAGYRAGPARGAGTGRQVTITPTPMISRGTSTPIDLGFVKSRLYGAGDFFSTPITVVRSLANVRPNGYMRIDDVDRDSIAELRGHLARIPNITDQTRLNILNEYLKTTTETQRKNLLNDVGRMGAAKVAEKHGLAPQAGLDIYQEHLKRQLGEIDNMKRYSAAMKPVQTVNGAIAQVKVDEFMDNGGKLVVAPNLVTRLANDHVFQDLDEMDKVLARHASALKAIRQTRLGNPDWILDATDHLSSLWKFGTLFRLGYIPRVAGDDLAGQVARLGAASMALRAGWGVRNGATNAALWLARPFQAAKAATAQEGADFAKKAMDDLYQSEIQPLEQRVTLRQHNAQISLNRAQRQLASAQARQAALLATATPTQAVAATRFVAARQAAVSAAKRDLATGAADQRQRLQELQAHHDWLDQQRAAQQKTADDLHAQLAAPKRIQGNQPVRLPDGTVAPPAFAGKQGEMYQQRVSSDESIGQMFATNKRIVHGHLMRSFDHGAKVISPAQDETLHAQSWAHAINAQLAQDQLAAQAIRGANPEQMTQWLTGTAEGRQYQARLGLQVASPEDIANAAWHDVAEYLPTPEIRAKALEPEGVTPDFLKESVPMTGRPDVHTGQVGAGRRRYDRAMDGIMAGWFKFAASLPADRLSRHPLFAQLYEGHLKTLANQLKKQGAYDTSTAAVEQMATTARRLALRDTKRLVFDIAHRSDAAAALRFVSPFMAATTESFQRWGRIIADRPQVVGYGNIFFNTPIALGNMQDADGNDVTRGGYSYTIDPTTGKAVKRLVPKSERYIVARVPKSLARNLGVILGADPSSGKVRLSQNSMDLVTQGDPWFNPGVGPIVQIPVNHFVKDKPGAAEVARHLGVLPFGPQEGGGPLNAGAFLLPSTIKDFMTAYDTSDTRYQAVKLQIMQRAAYEHAELGKPMPSASEIAAMTRNYWLFSAGSAFLQPMATQKADAYQFYRDQYNALRRINPLTADQQFLDRYGESYFSFAQSQSKNDSGIPATKKAVELSKKYADLIAQNPELGALIVGPEGNGPFSPEAYSYQLNHPLTPGGAEMQRTKMSADEAMQENKRRLGWAKYTQFMNGLTAALHNRNLKSFSDKGAEDLAAKKRAIVSLYGSPTLPDGSANPWYNEAWSVDYNTLDTQKYERLVPALQQVANSPLANDPNRSDLRTLQLYLIGRQAVTQALAARNGAGGSAVITAKANVDLLDAWQRWVDGLVESDTRFGDLHSRYLARDLGYDGSQDDQAGQVQALLAA